jgi:hypothetical protein
MMHQISEDAMSQQMKRRGTMKSGVSLPCALKTAQPVVSLTDNRSVEDAQGSMVVEPESRQMQGVAKPGVSAYLDKDKGPSLA